MSIQPDGAIADDIHFFAAIVESKAKLAYDNVSDWLENRGDWQPESEAIAQQIRLLQQVCERRNAWRHQHALVFKDRPDYRFVLGEKGEVLDIIAEPRRIANRIVEESMIAANVCAARVLRDKLGFGIYNVHAGFDPANTEQLAALLKSHGMHVDAQEVLTLEAPPRTGCAADRVPGQPYSSFPVLCGNQHRTRRAFWFRPGSLRDLDFADS